MNWEPKPGEVVEYIGNPNKFTEWFTPNKLYVIGDTTFGNRGYVLWIEKDDTEMMHPLTRENFLKNFKLAPNSAQILFSNKGLK